MEVHVALLQRAKQITQIQNIAYQSGIPESWFTGLTGCRLSIYLVIFLESNLDRFILKHVNNNGGEFVHTEGKVTMCD